MSRLFCIGRFPGMRGLLNCGLSCCVNALLQSFSATPELLELLMKWEHLGGPEEKLNVPLQLRNTLLAMTEQWEPAPHRNFLNCLHHYHICRNTEHDADEVYHCILNLIQKQMTNQDLAAEIKNTFKIEMEGHIQCSECTYIHSVPTHFLSLPLDIHEDKNSIESCVRSFFKEQKLEDSESFYCDRCGDKKPSSQVFRLVSLPPVLCIYLKRFRSCTGYPRKLYCEVTFPQLINMTEMLPKEHPEIPEARYKLYAVIVHSGSATFGHYTAYICSLEGKWYHMDDSHVQNASWQDVQWTFGGDDRRHTAYMLLYRRSSSDVVQSTPMES